MKSVIKLSKYELESNLSRVNWAEELIELLDENHEGRNSWLMDYGVGETAQAIRKNDKEKYKDTRCVPRKLIWDDETDCFKTKI